MPVVDDYREYFDLVKAYNTAPPWRKELLIRGSLLTRCLEMEPVRPRLKLQAFWSQQASLLGIQVGELKTWN